MWMMPKHVFEKVGDPLKFDFNQPVSLGAYVLHSYDPNGKWFIWQKRDDWQRTTLAPLRRARPEIRRLRRSRPAGQARDRAAQPRARHHPRHLARGHVHARQAVEDVARLVQGLPLRPSRSDAAGGDLQHPERAVQEPRRALGAGAADRHQGGVDGVLSRRRDHLGDRRAADRHAPRTSITRRWRTGCKDFELDTGKRKIKPYDPTIGKQIADMLRPSHGRPDPDRSPTRSPSRSAAAGGSPIRRPRPELLRARRLHQAAATSGSRPTASRSSIRIDGRGRRRGR